MSSPSYHDIPVNNGNHMTGYQYSVTDSSGWVNESAQGGIKLLWRIAGKPCPLSSFGSGCRL